MSMTLAEMYTFVRTHADADEEDAPDDSLKVYARIAYRDILNRRVGWPHLAVAYTFVTADGTEDYAFSSFSSADLEILSSVQGSTGLKRRLIYLTRADAMELYGVNANIGVQTFNVSNDTVTLFPTPSGVETFTVRGFRAPAAWPTTAGSTPDLPEALHEAICWYMLSSYFLAQEDTQLAGVYLGEYDRMVNRHLNFETTKDTRARPNIMGGQNVRMPTRLNINY